MSTGPWKSLESRRAWAISLLRDGYGIRAVCRLTGLNRKTVRLISWTCRGCGGTVRRECYLCKARKYLEKAS